MSLPLPATDRLFDRLQATYGAEFSARYAGLDSGSVKTIWAHALAGFANDLQSIAWALENLPERAPNAIQFRNLARQAPAKATPQLPEPKADQERVARELARLGEVRKAAAQKDGRGWARRILARHQAGDRVRPYTLQTAQSAMRGDVYA